MKNYVQKGHSVDLTMPYDRTAGQGVLVGQIFGVCANDAVSGAVTEVQTRGVFDVTKDTSTFSQGDAVYWDNSAKKCSSTAGVRVGYAVQAQLTGDATVRVALAYVGPQAAHVADASAGSAAEINALRDALIAVGVMKSS